MSRKSDKDLERRLTQLFGDAERQARIDVLPVMDEAIKQGALDGSRVAVSVSKVVEIRASATLDNALVSLDKSGGRRGRAGLVRTAIDHFFRAVADVGKQGPAFPGSRDALIDSLNEEARLRMQRRVDTHLGGWNDPNQPWHVRNSFAWEWVKISLSGGVGFASGIALMHRTLHPATPNPGLQEKIDRILEQIERPKDRAWAKRKLNPHEEPALSTRLFQIFTGLGIGFPSAEIEAFAQKCATRRNDLSHHGGARDGEEYDDFLHEIIALNRALDLLYHARVLQEAGIPSSQLSAWFVRNPSTYWLRKTLAAVGLNLPASPSSDSVD